ncbi:MAG TPA: hypothetical protein VH740_26615 [Vicinamibacterales bacterium]|jgi:hypothetical protein
MTRSPTLDVFSAACAAAFVVVLAVSAYWDPTIRMLHVFEAVPYLVAAMLTLRQKKPGYILGFASGGFWLWMAGTRTTFVRNGFEQLAILLRTGHVDQPDVLIAAPAAIATGGLALLSLVGYFRSRTRSWRDAGLFVLALGAIAAYFAAIFAAFAPRYLVLFERLFQ